jgi:hypothetical protein
VEAAEGSQDNLEDGRQQQHFEQAREGNEGPEDESSDRRFSRDDIRMSGSVDGQQKPQRKSTF